MNENIKYNPKLYKLHTRFLMLTQGRLKEIYFYDPISGIFPLKIRRGPRKIGSTAGTTNKSGYLQITLDNKRYLAHRLAWFYMTGEWPSQWVDHKDTDRTNNSFANLRLVTPSVSNRNRGVNKRNKSGKTGVVWDNRRDKWCAYIGVNSEMVHLGCYEYKEDAILARISAEKKYGYWLDRAMDNL